MSPAEELMRDALADLEVLELSAEARERVRQLQVRVTARDRFTSYPLLTSCQKQTVGFALG